MAAVSYFLKLDGIPGESVDAKHPNEIELLSFSWGEASSIVASPSGAGAGKVHVEDLHITMPTSKASPHLFLACATGQHLKTAVLTARKAGKAPLEFFVITLTDVLISSYHVGGSGGDSGLFDQVSLNFGKVQILYRPQKPDGTGDTPVEAGWDVKRNAKI